MKVTKVAQFGNVPAGTLIWLNDEQARSRAHAITEVSTEKTRKDRKLYAADQQIGFKAGEELGIEGDLDRGLQTMFGIVDAGEDTSEKPDAKGCKAKPVDQSASIRKSFAEGEQAGAADLLSDIERALGLQPVSLEERLKGGGAGKQVLLEAIAKAKGEGRTEMMAEVEAYNAAVDEHDEAETLLLEADDAGKVAAQQRYDKAKAALDALPELKA